MIVLVKLFSISCLRKYINILLKQHTPKIAHQFKKTMCLLKMWNITEGRRVSELARDPAVLWFTQQIAITATGGFD